MPDTRTTTPLSDHPAVIAQVRRHAAVRAARDWDGRDDGDLLRGLARELGTTLVHLAYVAEFDARQAANATTPTEG